MSNYFECIAPLFLSDLLHTNIYIYLHVVLAGEADLGDWVKAIGVSKTSGFWGSKTSGFGGSNRDNPEACNRGSIIITHTEIIILS